MAAGVNSTGLFTHLRDHYFEWSGRYTGNALYAIYPVITGMFSGYQFIPALMLLAILLATVYFLSALFRLGIFNRTIWLASLCFVCVFLLGMTSTASSMYWMAGAFTYQTANFLFLVILGLSIQLADRQKSSQNYYRLLFVLLLACILEIGTNETSMLGLTVLAFVSVMLHARAGWSGMKPWLIVFLVVLICFAIVYFSPGNSIRAADFPLRYDFFRSVKGSLSVGLSILWLWISNPVLIISSLLAPFAIARLDQESSRTFTVTSTHIATLLIIALALPVLLQFPAWWSMGGWPPARTVDVIYFLFIICWYMTIGAVTLYFLGPDKQKAVTCLHQPRTAIMVIFLTITFVFAALASRNYQAALNDLLHLARPYHEYLNARYKLIELAKTRGEYFLVVPDYKAELPRSIFFNDIMRNPDHWRNACYADYFGLKKIKRD